MLAWSTSLFTHLGLQDDPQGGCFVRSFVQVHCANTIRVAHDWYSGVVLNALDELVAPSWHDQVDVFVLSEERRDFRPRRDGLDERWWDRGGL
jgi:hypothetical protein